jgi:hypothetical protein
MEPWEETRRDLARPLRAARLTSANAVILLNIAGFAVTGFAHARWPGLLDWLAFDAKSAFLGGRPWQLLTWSFVQVVDPWYLFGFLLGSYAIYTLGNELEGSTDGRRFLRLYLALVLAGAAAHAARQLLFLYPEGRDVRAATLVGPAFGVALTAALRSPGRPMLLLFVLPVRTVTGVAVLGLGAIFLCALYFPAGIAPMIGAALVAVAAGGLAPRWREFREEAAARRDRERFLREVETLKRSDGLLEKIGREGMASLTKEERRTLERASAILRERRRGESS